MQPIDALLAAVRAAPRRYRLPPLPRDAQAAAGAVPASAVAFALECARVALEAGAPAPAHLQDLFTTSLAQVVRQALAPDGGDPAFQALVLQSHAPEVREYAQLSAQAAGDRRAVRAAVDAWAHPGKLRAQPAGPLRDALAGLHALAAAQSWTELAQAARELAHAGPAPDGLRAALAALAASAALQRLVRGRLLRDAAGVRRHQALRGARGPLAGSAAATARGRAAARTGADAEQATAHAFRALADLLAQHEPAGGWRVVRGLRAPRGFPGEPGRAKQEWDVALVRAAGPGDAQIVLLAEVKAAPAAAGADYPRLHRGLQRLAQAAPRGCYAFATADGELRLRGESLRALQPHGGALPPHVLYCCTAPPEREPQLLGAASQGVLLAQGATLAFARELMDGGSPPPALLAPVWAALLGQSRLRPVLHQYRTAQAAREAMLHPADLLAAARQRLVPDAVEQPGPRIS